MKFLAIFLFVYLLKGALQIFLYLANLSYARKMSKVPEALKDVMNEDDFEKSRLYTIEKMQFNILKTIIDTLLMLILIIVGVPYIERLVSRVPLNEVFQGILFFFVVYAIYYIINLPIEYYRVFVLEKKYGFSKMNLKLFISDELKQILISAVLGFVVLFTFFYIASVTSNWWLFVSLFAVFFVILSQIIFPFILPLFNKLEPIKDAELKTKIEELAKRVSLSISNIFVIDESKRSLHTNAFFSGFGRWKRLILYDTLLRVHPEDEILAIVAHEIGHYIKRHIIKFTVLTSLILFAVVYSVFVLSNSSVINLAFGVNKFYSVVLYAFIFISSIMSLFEFAFNSISRKFEYEADSVSAELTSKQSIINALKRLAKANLSFPYAHPLFVLYKYSHPTIIERIEAVEKL
jgi:STE24 endopeptidase